MSLRNAKEYRSMTAQLMSQNLPIVSCSFGNFCVLRHPNHFVLSGANNRNVIITYRFLAAPVQANHDFFYIDCMTVYFSCKYFPKYTRELLECLLGISPSGRNPCGGSKPHICIVQPRPNIPSHSVLSTECSFITHDVTSAKQNKTAAMLVSQTNPVGIAPFFKVKTCFCFKKCA